MKKYSNGRVGKKYMGRFAAVILAVAVLAGCGEKALMITELQTPEGKRMSGKSYLLGHPLQAGAKFM